MRSAGVQVDTVEVIGFVAAACTALSFFPQAIKVIREKETAGISLLTYSVFVVGLTLWLTYGVLTHSAPVYVANAVTLVPAVIILAMKIKLG